jgi:hypothetical protein
LAELISKDLAKQQQWDNNPVSDTGKYVPLNDGYCVLHVGPPELVKQALGDFH